MSKETVRICDTCKERKAERRCPVCDADVCEACRGSVRVAGMTYAPLCRLCTSALEQFKETLDGKMAIEDSVSQALTVVFRRQRKADAGQ